MRRAGWWIAVVVVLVVMAASSWQLLRPGATVPPASVSVGRPARITPDYRGCSIPPNIAPMNFVIDEQGTRYRTHIHSESGEGFVVASRSPRVIIPMKKWSDLLQRNRCNALHLDIYVQAGQGLG